jgi:hypothetical protein
MEFTRALLKKSKSRVIYKSIDHIVQIMKLDDWSLVMKALRVAVALFDRSTSFRQDEKEQKNKELEECLLNIAFGYNLKNSKKYSFIEVLRDKTLISTDVQFRYYVAAKEAPSIITIQLTELYKDRRSSEEITKEIATKNNIPVEYHNALCCKVRLAKTVVTQEAKEQTVIASLIAYIAFSNPCAFI